MNPSSRAPGLRLDSAHTERFSYPCQLDDLSEATFPGPVPPLGHVHDAATTIADFLEQFVAANLCHPAFEHRQEGDTDCFSAAAAAEEQIPLVQSAATRLSPARAQKGIVLRQAAPDRPPLSVIGKFARASKSVALVQRGSCNRKSNVISVCLIVIAS